jgi:hypothetical protein
MSDGCKSDQKRNLPERAGSSTIISRFSVLTTANSACSPLLLREQRTNICPRRWRHPFLPSRKRGLQSIAAPPTICPSWFRRIPIRCWRSVAREREETRAAGLPARTPRGVTAGSTKTSVEINKRSRWSLDQAISVTTENGMSRSF